MRLVVNTVYSCRLSGGANVGISFVIFAKQPKKPIFEKGVFSRLNGENIILSAKIKNLSVQNSCIVADNGKF